jgi:hypothetical protein
VKFHSPPLVVALVETHLEEVTNFSTVDWSAEISIVFRNAFGWPVIQLKADSFFRNLLLVVKSLDVARSIS